MVSGMPGTGLGALVVSATTVTIALPALNGWRGIFIFFGALELVFALVYALLAKDKPKPLQNKFEKFKSSEVHQESRLLWRFGWLVESQGHLAAFCNTRANHGFRECRNQLDPSTPWRERKLCCVHRRDRCHHLGRCDRWKHFLYSPLRSVRATQAGHVGKHPDSRAVIVLVAGVIIRRSFTRGWISFGIFLFLFLSDDIYLCQPDFQRYIART